jgi:hypothetical protein
VIFTGIVTFEEVIRSEREISGNSKYRALWYVVADFMNAQHPGMNESECDDVRSLCIGGFYSNPRIKFALATADSKFKRVIEMSVINGHALHSTKILKHLKPRCLGPLSYEVRTRKVI